VHQHLPYLLQLIFGTVLFGASWAAAGAVLLCLFGPSATSLSHYQTEVSVATAAGAEGEVETVDHTHVVLGQDLRLQARGDRGKAQWKHGRARLV
jgi:hypothetical protein